MPKNLREEYPLDPLTWIVPPLYVIFKFVVYCHVKYQLLDEKELYAKILTFDLGLLISTSGHDFCIVYIHTNDIMMIEPKLFELRTAVSFWGQ